MTPPKQLSEYNDKVVVKINGETYATAEPGLTLGEIVSRNAQASNLRSFAVLLDNVKQNNGPESRGTQLKGGQTIELIAKDTRGVFNKLQK